MADNGRNNRGKKRRPISKTSVKTPFQNASSEIYLRDAALGYAMAWFMMRGYCASVPVVQETYDLIAASDDGLQKIQIKTTNRRNRWGQYFVHVSRRIYDASAPTNANGKRRRAVYAEHDVDWFFILTGNHDTYLMPRSVVSSKKCLTLDRLYANYKH